MRLLLEWLSLVGMMAHFQAEYPLKQLQRENAELLSSVLGNVNVRVMFRVGEPDARVLQNSIVHFEATDLQNLSRGEAILTIEQPQYDCSIATVPLSSVSADEKESNMHTILLKSRAAYATPRADVEKYLFESLGLDMQAKEKPSTSTKEKDADSTKRTKIETVQEHTEIIQSQFKETPVVEAISESNVSTHRYLQTLVKKMAEARGYTAILEAQLPKDNGQVDVLLSKENKTIAVEICNTTNAEWEAHNVLKCIESNYTTVISLAGDIKQLERIKQKCINLIPDFSLKDVKFLSPDALFSYLDESDQQNISKEKIIKGYRVNVSYDNINASETDNKKKSIALVVLNSLKKKEKLKILVPAV